VTRVGVVELWTHRHAFGAITAQTRTHFHDRLEAWGGGRWPERVLARADMAGDVMAREDLAREDLAPRAVVSA
jgi:hypothetical protein